MKRFLFLLLIAAMAIAAPATWAMADDSPSMAQKPVAVVSLAGYDAFIGDIKYVATLANNPELGVGVEGLLKLVTKNQGLAGLDKTKPWGAVLYVTGEKPTGYVFLPVTDFAKLADATEGLIGKVEDLGNGLHKIPGKDHKPPTYAKEGKGWAFFADKEENLTNLPDDPSSLLGGLNKQYQAAVRLNAGDMSPELRQKVLAGIETGAARDSGKRWNESEEDHALRLKVIGEVVKYVKTIVNDLQDITLGWNLDTKADKCYLEATVVAKAGTEMAKAIQMSRDSHSRFAGFAVNDAAIVGNVNGQLPAFKADFLKEVIDAIQKKAAADIEKHDKGPSAEAGKQFVEKLFPMIQETIANGRVDKGVSIVLKPNALTVLAGGAIVNNGRLEEMANLVVGAIKADHPEMTANIDNWVKLNAGEFNGVALHTISIPIPPDANDRDKVVPLIGETLEVVIGTNKDSVYLAAGRDPMDALKKAIEQSAADVSKSVPPMEISISLSKVADFVAAVGKPHERPQAAKLAAALKESSGGDHAILRAQPIDNGMRYRLEIEPGVLKAIGQMQK